MKRGAPGDFEESKAKRPRKEETVFDLIEEMHDSYKGDFSGLWDATYKNQATPEDMLRIVEDGPNKGRSGLWFVAFDGKFADFYQRFKAGTLGGGTFNKLWSYIQGGPTPEQWALFKKALFSKADFFEASKGSFKGTSPFWLLSERNPESALEIFELVKNEISLDDMLALPEDGHADSFLSFLLKTDFEKGSEALMHLLEVEKRSRSLVDCFLLQADQKVPLFNLILKHGLFMKVWEAFGEEIPLEHLWRNCFIRSTLIGSDYLNGKYSLLKLILAYTNKEPALLFNLLEALKRKNRLSHLFKCELNGPELPFLLLLKENALEEVLSRFEEDIALEDLFPILQSTYDHLSLKSILRIWDKHCKQKDLEWYSNNKLMRFFTRILTSASYLETPEHIKQRAMVLVNQIDFKYLVTPEDSPPEGKSILWYAAFFCRTQNNFELFRTLWERYNDQITFDHVHTQFSTKCATVIFLLAEAAYDNLQNPIAIETFLMVYKKFKHLINLEALVEDRRSIFLHLAEIAKSLQCTHHHKGKIIKILKEKLRQDPGIMEDRPILFKSLEQLIPEIDVNKLIESKNALFSFRDSLKDQPMNEEKYNHLMALAKAAFDAGYINPFYDIKSSVRSKDYYGVLKNVLPKSSHFQEVSYDLAEHYYMKFLDGKDRLKKALASAIKLTDPAQRNQFIQKIGFYFITDSRPEKGVQPAEAALLPEGLLPAFNETAGVETCLLLFSQVKAQKQEEMSKEKPVIELTLK